MGRDADFKVHIAGEQVPIQTFILKNPKLGLWLDAMDLLSDIYKQQEAITLELDYGKLVTQRLRSQPSSLNPAT